MDRYHTTAISPDALAAMGKSLELAEQFALALQELISERAALRDKVEYNNRVIANACTLLRQSYDAAHQHPSDTILKLEIGRFLGYHDKTGWEPK